MQDAVDSRLSVFGFSDTVRAVCAVLCRGACAVDARRSRSKCSWVRNDGKVTPFAGSRGQSAQKTSPPSECVALGASERPLDAYPNRDPRANSFTTTASAMNRSCPRWGNSPGSGDPGPSRDEARRSVLRAAGQFKY